MKIRVELSDASIDAAVAQLTAYREKLNRVGNEIAEKLSQLGYQTAYLIMNEHIYSGDTIGSLTVEEVGPAKYILKAGSQALLFFEFGAGINGGGHPLAGEFGFGPGTYPGKGHWNNPHGWFYETDDPDLIVKYGKDGQGLGHSYGNPPHMPMYLASREMRDELLNVAKEVMQR